ncbi:hypothetical protein AWZ03_007918 [Drosophila navojoa]|uniref:DUF4729 domain-containing protein n=1 Tax=Drosophila navojoa TaxID=7232 RepID=A0A484BA29_DRONA|nr:uncharacterized protein LOC115563034 [Drosophila navojoa]TDG45643.1 hypothetical protein AWZ03_007918 [Drosophila navojoa]
MQPASSSNGITTGFDADDFPKSRSSKRRQRRKEKHIKHLEDTKHLICTKHFSNYRLPVAVASTDFKMVQLSRYESIIDRDRHPPLYVIPDQKSEWARLKMISCPCHGCDCALDPNGWLSHYINVHMRRLGVPFVDVPFPVEKQTLRASCNLSYLDYDVHTLLSVYGYQRFGLNPLKCPRNTLLPKEYRKYSQHGVLLLFACRTRHGLLWHRKQIDDVVAIWVATPMQGVTVSLRCVVQPSESVRYYSKRLQSRQLPTSGLKPTPCRDFIKTDFNVVVISFEDLRELMAKSEGEQVLNVELHLMGEQRI